MASFNFAGVSTTPPVPPVRKRAIPNSGPILNQQSLNLPLDVRINSALLSSRSSSGSRSYLGHRLGSEVIQPSKGNPEEFMPKRSRLLEQVLPSTGGSSSRGVQDNSIAGESPQSIGGSSAVELQQHLGASAGLVTNLTVDLSETAGGYHLAPDTESGPISFLPKLAGNGWKNGATGSPTEHVPLTSPSSHAGRLLVDVSHDPREIAKDYANHFRFLVESQLPVDRTVELMSKFMAQPATVRHAATRQFSEWTMSEVLVPKVDGAGYEFLNINSPKIRGSVYESEKTGQYQIVNLVLLALKDKSEDEILALIPAIEVFLKGVHPNEFTSRYDSDGDLPHHSLCKYLLTESPFSVDTATNLLRIFYERRATYGGLNLFAQRVNDGSGKTMINLLADSSEEFAATRGLRAGVLRSVLENIGFDNAVILMRESGFSDITHTAELPLGPIKQVLDDAISTLFKPA